MSLEYNGGEQCEQAKGNNVDTENTNTKPWTQYSNKPNFYQGGWGSYRGNRGFSHGCYFRGRNRGFRGGGNPNKFRHLSGEDNEQENQSPNAHDGSFDKNISRDKSPSESRSRSRGRSNRKDNLDRSYKYRSRGRSRHRHRTQDRHSRSPRHRSCRSYSRERRHRENRRATGYHKVVKQWSAQLRENDKIICIGSSSENLAETLDDRSFCSDSLNQEKEDEIDFTDSINCGNRKPLDQPRGLSDIKVKYKYLQSTKSRNDLRNKIGPGMYIHKKGLNLDENESFHYYRDQSLSDNNENQPIDGCDSNSSVFDTSFQGKTKNTSSSSVTNIAQGISKICQSQITNGGKRSILEENKSPVVKKPKLMEDIGQGDAEQNQNNFNPLKTYDNVKTNVSDCHKHNLPSDSSLPEDFNGSIQSDHCVENKHHQSSHPATNTTDSLYSGSKSIVSGGQEVTNSLYSGSRSIVSDGQEVTQTSPHSRRSSVYIPPDEEVQSVPYFTNISHSRKLVNKLRHKKLIQKFPYSASKDSAQGKLSYNKGNTNNKAVNSVDQQLVGNNDGNVHMNTIDGEPILLPPNLPSKAQIDMAIDWFLKNSPANVNSLSQLENHVDVSNKEVCRGVEHDRQKKSDLCKNISCDKKTKVDCVLRHCNEHTNEDNPYSNKCRTDDVEKGLESKDRKSTDKKNIECSSLSGNKKHSKHIDKKKDKSHISRDQRKEVFKDERKQNMSKSDHLVKDANHMSYVLLKDVTASPVACPTFDDKVTSTPVAYRTSVCHNDLIISPVSSVQTSRSSVSKGTTKLTTSVDGKHNKVQDTFLSEAVSDCSMEYISVDSWHDDSTRSNLDLSYNSSISDNKLINIKSKSKSVGQSLHNSSNQLTVKETCGNHVTESHDITDKELVDIEKEIAEGKNIFDKLVTKKKSEKRNKSPLRVSDVKKINAENKVARLRKEDSKLTKSDKIHEETKHENTCHKKAAINQGTEHMSIKEKRSNLNHKSKHENNLNEKLTDTQTSKERKNDNLKKDKELVKFDKVLNDKVNEEETQKTVKVVVNELTSPCDKVKSPPVHSLFGRKIRTGLEDFHLIRTPNKERKSENDQEPSNSGNKHENNMSKRSSKEKKAKTSLFQVPTDFVQNMKRKLSKSTAVKRLDTAKPKILKLGCTTNSGNKNDNENDNSTSTELHVNKKKGKKDESKNLHKESKTHMKSATIEDITESRDINKVKRPENSVSSKESNIYEHNMEKCSEGIVKKVKDKLSKSHKQAYNDVMKHEKSQKEKDRHQFGDNTASLIPIKVPKQTVSNQSNQLDLESKTRAASKHRSEKNSTTQSGNRVTSADMKTNHKNKTINIVVQGQNSTGKPDQCTITKLDDNQVSINNTELSRDFCEITEKQTSKNDKKVSTSALEYDTNICGNTTGIEDYNPDCTGTADQMIKEVSRNHNYDVFNKVDGKNMEKESLVVPQISPGPKDTSDSLQKEKIEDDISNRDILGRANGLHLPVVNNKPDQNVMSKHSAEESFECVAIIENVELSFEELTKLDNVQKVESILIIEGDSIAKGQPDCFGNSQYSVDKSDSDTLNDTGSLHSADEIDENELMADIETNELDISQEVTVETSIEEEASNNTNTKGIIETSSSMDCTVEKNKVQESGEDQKLSENIDDNNEISKVDKEIEIKSSDEILLESNPEFLLCQSEQSIEHLVQDVGSCIDKNLTEPWKERSGEHMEESTTVARDNNEQSPESTQKKKPIKWTWPKSQCKPGITTVHNEMSSWYSRHKQTSKLSPDRFHSSEKQVSGEKIKQLKEKLSHLAQQSNEVYSDVLSNVSRMDKDLKEAQHESNIKINTSKSFSNKAAGDVVVKNMRNKSEMINTDIGTCNLDPYCVDKRLKIVSVCGNMDIDMISKQDKTNVEDVRNEVSSGNVDRPATPSLDNIDIIMNSSPLKLFTKIVNKSNDNPLIEEKLQKDVPTIQVVKMPSLGQKTNMNTLTPTLIQNEVNMSTSESEFDSSADKLIIDTDQEETSVESNEQQEICNNNLGKKQTDQQATTYSTIDSTVKETIGSTTKETIDSTMEETIDTTMKETIDSTMKETIDSTMKETIDSIIKETVASTMKKPSASSTLASESQDRGQDEKQNSINNTSAEETIIYASSATDKDSSKDTDDYSRELQNQSDFITELVNQSNTVTLAQDDDNNDEFDEGDDEDIQIMWYIKGVPQSPWAPAKPHVKEEVLDEEEDDFKQPPVLPELAEYFSENPDLLTKTQQSNMSGNSSILASSQLDSPRLEDTLNNLFFSNLPQESHVKYEATPLKNIGEHSNQMDTDNHNNKKDTDNHTIQMDTDNHNYNKDTDNHTYQMDTDNHNFKKDTDNHTYQMDTDNHTNQTESDIKCEQSDKSTSNSDTDNCEGHRSLKLDRYPDKLAEFKRKIKKVVGVSINDKYEIKSTSEDIRYEGDVTSDKAMKNHHVSNSEETEVSHQPSSDTSLPSSINMTTTQITEDRSPSSLSVDGKDDDRPPSVENMYDTMKQHCRQRRSSSKPSPNLLNPVMGSLLFPPAIQQAQMTNVIPSSLHQQIQQGHPQQEQQQQQQQQQELGQSTVRNSEINDSTNKLKKCMEIFSQKLTNNGTYDFSRFNNVHFSHVKVLTNGTVRNTIGEFLPSFLKDRLLRCVNCTGCRESFSPYCFMKHVCQVPTKLVSDKSHRNNPIPTEKLEGSATVLWKLLLYVLQMEKYLRKNENDMESLCDGITTEILRARLYLVSKSNVTTSQPSQTSIASSTSSVAGQHWNEILSQRSSQQSFPFNNYQPNVMGQYIQNQAARMPGQQVCQQQLNNHSYQGHYQQYQGHVMNQQTSDRYMPYNLPPCSQHNGNVLPNLTSDVSQTSSYQTHRNSSIQQGGQMTNYQQIQLMSNVRYQGKNNQTSHGVHSVQSSGRNYSIHPQHSQVKQGHSLPQGQMLDTVRPKDSKNSGQGAVTLESIEKICSPITSRISGQLTPSDRNRHNDTSSDRNTHNDTPSDRNAHNDTSQIKPQNMDSCSVNSKNRSHSVSNEECSSHGEFSELSTVRPRLSDPTTQCDQKKIKVCEDINRNVKKLIGTSNQTCNYGDTLQSLSVPSNPTTISLRQLQINSPEEAMRYFRLAQEIQLNALSSISQILHKDKENFDKLQKEMDAEKERRSEAERRLQQIEKQVEMMQNLIHKD